MDQVNGMTGNRSYGAVAQYAHHNADGAMDSHHTVPIESFVHYVDAEGTCMCGPYRATVEHLGSIITYFTHTWLEEPGDNWWDDDGDDEPHIDPDPDPEGGVGLDLPTLVENAPDASEGTLDAGKLFDYFDDIDDDT